VGWCGGVRDDKDLEILAQAWPNVARRYPDVHFLVGGYESRALIDCLPADRVTFMPGVSFETYPEMLINFDIACCIVDDNSWNENKTGIKWIEHSIGGAACVVSKALYGRYVKDLNNALVAETVWDWEMLLGSLIEDAQLRAAIVRNAQKTIIEEHTLAANWINWPLAYMSTF
jgi:hypothetical protein